MKTKAFRCGAIAVATVMALTLAGALLMRPAEAQPGGSRFNIGMPPTAVAPGDTVRFALFNASGQPTAGRFAIHDGVEGGGPLVSSETISVPAGEGVVFDVLIHGGNFPPEGEILGVFQGWRGRPLLASIQVRDPAGQTMTFMTMDEMTGE